MHHVSQAAILVLTSSSMWLIAAPAFAWWGFALGLAAQPLWLASTWRARQWGMFANAVFYTGALVAGLLNHHY
jgi:predicted MFS family arabinose efflux permease